jgi:hypothetical protein
LVLKGLIRVSLVELEQAKLELAELLDNIKELGDSL